ncbi:MAG: YCF48-related protein [candidate division WOR-3 bacterium]
MGQNKKGGKDVTRYLSIGLLSILFAQGSYTLSSDLSQFEFSIENEFDRVRGIAMSAPTDMYTSEFLSRYTPVKQLLWQLQRTETFKVNLNDAFAVDAVPGLVYAVGDSGYIIKHDPVSNNWIRLNSPSTVNLMGVFFLNALERWVCGENGVILHTNDGGNTFEFQYPPTTLCISDIQFLDNQNGYALVWLTANNTGTLLFTTNGGVSWYSREIPNLPSPPGPDYKFVLSDLEFVSQSEGWVTGYIWLDPQSSKDGEEFVWDRFPPGIIYHTTDGGISWTNQTSSADYGYSEICFVNSRTGWVVSHTSYAWQSQALFYTTNGGDSWSIQFLWEGPIIDVCFDNANEGWLLVLRSYYTSNYHPAVLRTTNGGSNWLDDMNFKCHSFKVNQITTSPNFGWVVGDNGLIMSRRFMVWNIETWGGLTLCDVSFVDAQNGWLHGHHGMILRTTNCGTTWEYQCINELEAEVIGEGIDFIDNQRGWTCGYTLAGTGSGVIAYSSNSGNTWNYISRLPWQALVDLDFVNQNEGWAVTQGWYNHSTGAILHSSDGGYTWEVQLQSISFSHVRFFDQNYGWAVEPPLGVWFTADGGETWSLRPLARAWIDVCPLSPDSAWIVGVEPVTRNPKVGFTTDQGLTWDVKALDYPGHGGRAIEFIDPTFGWIVGQNGLILGTVDAGNSWFQEDGGIETDLLEVCFPDPYHGYAVGDRGTVLYRYLPYNLSSSPLSTAYEAAKIAHPTAQPNFWTVYQSAGRIFASLYTATNAIHRRMLGEGENPCLAMNDIGNPCVIWQRNIEPTPQVAGGELWFSRYDGTNWSEPYLLASFTGPFNLDVNPPSFIIDPLTNIGYMVFEWRDRFMNGPTSHLCLGWFEINNPANVQFSELESAIAPIRCGFPSISQGGNYLYIAFQREDKIFRIKWDIVNHQIVDRKQVSQDGRLAHHPFVDVHPNGLINYVYEDSTVNNIEIYRAYELNDVIYPVGNISNTPGKSQWPQICKGTTWITWSEYIWPPQDNNWEICYKDMEYEGYQILSQTLGMSKFSHGVVTRSPYWPPPYEPKLTAIWTEGNQSLYEIRAKTVTLPEISYFYVDAGKETPSPWTVQRDGYIQFAPEPEKTIDYHSQKLIYHFPNLNPAKRYRIKLVFYFESPGHNRWKMKIDADNIFHANLWLNLGEIATLERWLPTACYKDGEVYLNITKVIGDYALVAQIFIYEYEREIEEMAKNTQESNTSSFKEPRLSITPNPFYDHTVIHYFLPEDENQTKINIYDASGRLVQQFNHLIHTQSNQIKWDGTDCTGSALPNGIYFVVVTTSNYRLTKKIVLIR